jgi:hypothetical protein
MKILYYSKMKMDIISILMLGVKLEKMVYGVLFTSINLKDLQKIILS